MTWDHWEEHLVNPILCNCQESLIYIKPVMHDPTHYGNTITLIDISCDLGGHRRMKLCEDKEGWNCGPIWRIQNTNIAFGNVSWWCVIASHAKYGHDIISVGIPSPLWVFLRKWITLSLFPASHCCRLPSITAESSWHASECPWSPSPSSHAA